MQDRLRYAAIGTLGILAGCAHAPRLEVATNGQWPVSGTPTFALAPAEAGEPASLATSVTECLGHKGMTVSSPASPSAAYLVQIGLSDLPAGSNVIIGADNSDPAKKRSATRQRRQSLVVTLTSLHDGKEAYRASVLQRYRRLSGRQSTSALADAACGAIMGMTAAPQPS